MSDSKPMKTPVQPASAISRTSAGSSVTSIVTAALQIFSSGRSAGQSARRYSRSRAEVVVDEDGVGLVVGRELSRRPARRRASGTACAGHRSRDSRSRSGCGSRAWRSGWWWSESCGAAGGRAAAAGSSR